MTARSVKANTLRERHVATLKKTIETVLALTDEACISTIAVYKGELETNWSSYDEAFCEHEESLIGKEGADATLNTISAEHRETHTKYLKAKIKLGKLASSTSPNTTVMNTSLLDQTFNGEPMKMCKLPPIRLTPFAGEMRDWVEFKATCRSILTEKIHDVQRLQYLKDALQGEPRELVKHILPAEGAYEKAMFLLKKRYENTRAIVNDQLRRLYFLPHNDPSSENITTLRTVVNTIHSVQASLNGCEIDTSTWDSILVFNTSQCLHAETRKAWEEKLEGTRIVPSLQHYLEFLDTRIIILESTQMSIAQMIPSKTKQFGRPSAPNHQPNNRAKILFTVRADYKCAICQQNHLSTRCDELPRMAPHDRKVAVQRANICYNCLQSFHMSAQCPFESTCKKCNEKHHTLLHVDKHSNVLVTQTTPDEPLQSAEDDQDVMSMICTENFYHVMDDTTTILATALVPVRCYGRSILLKALIDQGSTANLITERSCHLLKLPYVMDGTQMKGIGNTLVGKGVGKTQCTIGSIHDRDYQFEVQALVVKRIAEIAPTSNASVSNWKHLSPLSLADPKFLDAHKIDLLLGASVYAEILLGNVIKGKPDEPIAQLTKLGYIVFGPAQVNKEYHELCNTLQSNQTESEDNLSELIKSFWETEEVESSQQFTSEEISAEQAFVKGLRRAPDGKFIVDLPFKMDTNLPDCLGESRVQAERRLFASQRRFSRDPRIKASYDQNINEYLTLGHMKELENHEIARCFLPHHPVIKEASSTTKVRTVFDASARTSNGRSLNNILLVGPTIQLDIFDLLIQWRMHRYAFSGDIEKMYRQIWVNPDHALFQCILWQPPDCNEVKAYKLLTVTFGTASAPFQAIRSIDEIGQRLENSNPMLAEQIRKHFYVDDYLGSAHDINTAINLRKQITEELAKYGFNLRKWKASDAGILQGVENSEREEIINFDTTFKTLGIAWQPSTDMFQFKSSAPISNGQWTKRKILSEIAKLFDPLGWLAPCVAKAKMLMQEIWRLPNKFEWDTLVPTHIVTKWQQIYSQLCAPIPIQVPRWIGLTDDKSHVEIHGFCDASNLAFAAVVYVRIRHSDDNIVCNLVASKTKLAPIKTVTIPRLELCGARLLAKLIRRCTHTLALLDSPIYAWCDSMIVLSWLAASPSRWSVYVSNRVSSIQQELPFEHWKHVPTKQNPADIASRGALVSELANAELWWHGPSFLKEVTAFPVQPEAISEQNIPEQRKSARILHLATHDENYVLERFSDYNRLLRFTVYAMRWRNKNHNRAGVIKAREVARAEKQWILVVQSEMFGKELNDISHDKWVNVPTIRQLNPFIDECGILRMNGRVGNADILEQKTAIILPPKHHLTNLIIRDAHEQVIHGGVQLTLRKLREKFWIIHARSQVQGLIHKCVKCFRFRKQCMQQKMAELPSFRTEQARPFAFVGCDYAGFFEIKVSSNRNASTSKGYIALFICLTTKALHLELVDDLSTAEFIMAIENFIARRGIPALLYTDNGTNFIGGAKEITRFHEQIFSQNNAVTKLLAIKNIEFKTIPARASHMAGIWERAVGSVKYHLRRTLKDTKLHARQFDHVLKQIEACLNSRPLWAVTNEGDDIEVLTPSHFSNFQPINTLPRPDIAHIKMNRLDQYQFLYRLYCNFWKAWSVEYLHQLQPRSKWQKEHPNAIVGQIVLISEDNLPPSRWLHGRITAVYPAKDGLIRTVDVQCGKTSLRRPIHKLALLPIPDNDQLELFAQRGENVGAPTRMETVQKE